MPIDNRSTFDPTERILKLASEFGNVLPELVQPSIRQSGY